jgi:tRNA pseudouridine65 synthase
MAAVYDELYRDEHLVAVNKPSGLLVHRGWANDTVTLLSIVRDQVGQFVYPAHRLDRATSGALLFALDPSTAALLQQTFSSGNLVKNYLVLTRGIVPELGYVDHGLAKSKAHEKQPAQTALRRLATFERYSLLEARPYTGRQHQIRRHLKHLCFPVIGDTRYGKGEHNRRFRNDFGLHRLALHASKLSLLHPHTGVQLQFKAQLPPELALVFSRLGILDAASSAVQAAAWQPEMESLPRLSPPARAAGPAAAASGE